MIDLIHASEVFIHELRSIGSAEEIPVLPLRIVKSTGCRFVRLHEIERFGRRDLVCKRHEDQSCTTLSMPQVKALADC